MHHAPQIPYGPDSHGVRASMAQPQPLSAPEITSEISDMSSEIPDLELPSSDWSASSSDAEAENSIPELTFGVEIELILLFHEERLRPHLSPSTVIHKSLIANSGEEKRLRYYRYPSNRYRSWAFSEFGSDASLRKYGCEHLTIARDLILEARNTERARRAAEPRRMKRGLPWTPAKASISVPDIEIGEKHGSNDYRKWQVVADGSLHGLDVAAKSAQLSKIGIPEEEHDEWDSMGIELVSPVYRVADLESAMRDINSLISSLCTSTSAVTTNQSCGLHVHIGLPHGRPMDIHALRNVGLLTAAFENHISLLHPPHRSVGRSDLWSNKMDSILAEPEDERDGKILNGKVFQSTGKSFASIRKSILCPVLSHDDADGYQALRSYMGPTRSNFVNWTRITSTFQPATLEFRQHGPSLDAGDIGHWVRFCAGLVELGYKYNETSYAAGGRHILDTMWSWRDHHDLDLLELLDAMVVHTSLLEADAEHFLGLFVLAKCQKRDPEDGIWEEKWEDDDLTALADSGLAFRA